MKKFDYCIIGGSIAGTTAAETIRTKTKTATIGIISDEPHVLYSRVMISKAHFILEASPWERVFLRSPKDYKKQRIEMIFGIRADKVNSKKRIISLSNGDKIVYKKLLIATGGRAKKLTCRGITKKGVYILQNLDQAKDIILKQKIANNIVVIGGGFIAFELAGIFTKAKNGVTLCVRENRFWHDSLSKEASGIVEHALIKEGVTILKECELRGVVGEGQIKGVKLSTNVEIPCEFLVYGIGTDYTQEWLKSANIKQKNGIVTDKFLQTSDKYIWAAGDCVDLLGGGATSGFSKVTNWVHAQMQGKYAGEAMFEKKEKPFSGVSSYTSSGAGLVLSFIGNTSREAADSIILRGGKESYPKYGELFIRDNHLMGAILINRGNEIVSLRSLIEQKRDSNPLKALLKDPHSDLRELTH